LDSPKEIFAFFASLNSAFFELFSLPLLARTFFKPLKNEYREGLVRFSRVMGMVIKSVMIIVDLFIFIILVVVEIIILLFFLAFPIATIFLIFR
jgi:hypothetical protein